jgi:hypothetical protein
MYWKEILNQSDSFLNDPSEVYHFSLKGHPEYPHISKLDESEVLEMLSDFVRAEGHEPTIQNFLFFAPIFEVMLYQRHYPSIFG